MTVSGPIRAEDAAAYRSMVMQFPTIRIVVHSSNGDTVAAWVGEHVARMCSYEVEELEADLDLWLNIVHPADREKVSDIPRRLAAGQYTREDYRIYRKDGQMRWVTDVGLAASAPRDGLILSIRCATDVTTSKSVAQGVVDFKELVDETPVAITVRDLTGRMLYCNEATARLYEFPTPADMIGTTFEDVCAPEFIAELHERILPLVLAGPWASEVRLIRKDGSACHLKTYTNLYRDNDGFPVGFYSILTDITERVKAQEREALRAIRTTLLIQTSQELASSLDSQQILNIATKKLCETLDGVSVGATIDPSSGRLIHLSLCCPFGNETENMESAIRESNLTGDEVFGGGVAAKLVPNLREMSEAAARFVDAARQTGKTRLGPTVMAPITTDVDTFGILVSARPLGQEFDQEDLWFATEIASHASSALANAALYKHQAQIAETLQRSLIPVDPCIECLDIATLYAPAPGKAEVGGDFLDVFLLGHDKVAVIVGDVSGKGLEAAIHTAEAKYMLRAFAHQNCDPHHVVHSLNQALCDYLTDEIFITLLYFIIDAKMHTMTYVNAGHEMPILLCRDNDALIEIRPCGPVLGVTKDAVYSARHALIEPDDILFCYTDGLTDVRINGGRFGYARLCEVIASAPPGDARSMMDHVMGKVRSFGPCKQTDDQVVVIVRPLI